MIAAQQGSLRYARAQAESSGSSLLIMPLNKAGTDRSIPVVADAEELLTEELCCRR